MAAVRSGDVPFGIFKVKLSAGYNRPKGRILGQIQLRVHMVKVPLDLAVIWIVGRPIPRLVYLRDGELIDRHLRVRTSTTGLCVIRNKGMYRHAGLYSRVCVEVPDPTELGSSIVQDGVVALLSHLVEHVSTTKPSANYEHINVQVICIRAFTRVVYGELAKVGFQP